MECNVVLVVANSGPKGGTVDVQIDGLEEVSELDQLEIKGGDGWTYAAAAGAGLILGGPVGMAIAVGITGGAYLSGA